MLRIVIVCLILFFGYKYIDFEEHFDNEKPQIKISQQQNNKFKDINHKKTIITTLKEEKGLQITISDLESNLENVELFFKNKSTENNFLRFYKKFKINKNEITIDLNKTILNKSVFGTHLTTIRVVTTDNSFKKNKRTIDFKISNNLKLPFFEIEKQGLEPFIPNTVNWTIIKSNNVVISDIYSNQPNNTIFKKINDYSYGILFFHTNNNNYEITISDIYGNKYSKNISFLKLKKNIQPIVETNKQCFNVFKSLTIVNNEKQKDDFTYSLNYKKGFSISKGEGLLKGECNKKPYIIYSTNLNKINYLSFGIDEKKASKKINANLDLKGNDFIGDYILFNKNLFDINSYVKSYMSIK